MTIKISDCPNTSSDLTLDGDGKSVTEDITVAKESFITAMPMYGQDSDGTYIFDFGGTSKTINLNGIFQSSVVSEIQTFITNIESFINANQSTQNGYPKIFTDDIYGTINVKILNVETRRLKAEVYTIRWSIKLIQSSTSI